MKKCDIKIPLSYSYAYPPKWNAWGYDIDKSFYTYGEAGGQALFEEIDSPPDLKYSIGALIGINRRINLTGVHLLIAGMTRSGKTNMLNQILLSLGHWHHPEYLKLVVIDAKGGVLKDWSQVASYVPSDFKLIEEKLRFLYEELKRRLAKVRKPGNPNDQTSWNKYVYKKGKSAKEIMPHIVVVVDEFQNIIENEREKKGRGTPNMDEESLEEAARKAELKGEELPLLSIINRLAAMGSGLGFTLIFATQCPYAKYLEGSVKNNFEERVCFRVGGGEQARLVLGKKSEGDLAPMALKTGFFLLKKGGRRIALQAHYVKEHAIAIACRRWKKSGFSFKI